MLATSFARLAALSIVALVGLVGAASAAQPGYTTSQANLREGPGTSYDVMDVLPGYTDLVIDACTSSWCAVTTDGGDEGFVSKSLLAYGSSDDEADQADAEVCFYQQANFKGPNFCVEAGDEDGDIPGNFDNNIESILISGGLSVEVCTGFNQGGNCDSYDDNVSKLPSSLRNKITSYAVDGDNSSNDDDDNNSNIIILH
ncbi:MAG: SH3 domain-containing protein [Devosia sp.]